MRCIRVNGWDMTRLEITMVQYFSKKKEEVMTNEENEGSIYKKCC